MSMWLGPPSMNSHTTRLARGAKCGGRAASGLTGSSSGSLPFAARPIIAASASAPMPPPARARKSRRERGTSIEQGRIGRQENDMTDDLRNRTGGNRAERNQQKEAKKAKETK